MTKTYRLRINGREKTAVEAYSSGPGSPIHTYVLAGGDRIERFSGERWTLTVKGSAFWERKPTVDVETVN